MQISDPSTPPRVAEPDWSQTLREAMAALLPTSALEALIDRMEVAR